jgi:hypothetical protein
MVMETRKQLIWIAQTPAFSFKTTWHYFRVSCSQAQLLRIQIIRVKLASFSRAHNRDGCGVNVWKVIVYLNEQSRLVKPFKSAELENASKAVLLQLNQLQ